MPEEIHQLEIPCALSSRNKLIIRQDTASRLLAVGITTPDYNVVLRIEREQFLIAAKTIEQLP